MPFGRQYKQGAFEMHPPNKAIPAFFFTAAFRSKEAAKNKDFCTKKTVSHVVSGCIVGQKSAECRGPVLL
jgi:hypothetical protein